MTTQRIDDIWTRLGEEAQTRDDCIECGEVHINDVDFFEASTRRAQADGWRYGEVTCELREPGAGRMFVTLGTNGGFRMVRCVSSPSVPRGHVKWVARKETT